LIVSLLDLHPSPPGGSDESNEGQLEILEAGTGHGALTLHLARAIHGANSPLPINTIATPQASEISRTKVIPVEPAMSITSEESSAMQCWRAGRRAVVHTVDISEKHSIHAQKVVKNFRHGMYYNDVDFHVGDIPDFFASRKSSSRPFLSHVILDMPSPSSDNRLSLVAQHLQIDGKLLVFNPSVTQIVDCMQTIKEQRLPLVLESVLELGGGSLGGREWDVRIAKIRSTQRKLATSEVAVPSFWESIKGRLWKTKRQDIPEPKAPKDWAVVCRPKFNDRVVNGGFLGVWRRMREKEG
jgi:tRNA (adenine57-N1/adenine58-N1)-methyltransferase catalytic subunit